MTRGLRASSTGLSSGCVATSASDLKLSACTAPMRSPPPMRHRRLHPLRSRGAIQPRSTCRSRSPSAGYATPIFIRHATSGAVSCPRSTPVCPDTRSSVASPRPAPRLQNSRSAISLPSAAWSIPMEPALSASRGSSSFARTSPLPITFPDKHTGGVTYGGYSDSIVVTEKFVLKVPSNLDLAGAAPLLWRRRRLRYIRCQTSVCRRHSQIDIPVFRRIQLRAETSPCWV